MKTSILTKSQKMPSGLVKFYSMQLVFRFAWAIWIPLIAVYVLALGGTVLHLGELTALFGVMYSLGSYFVAKIGPQHRYTILPISYALSVAYAIALIFVNTVDQLYVVIGSGSIASSIIEPSLKGIPLDFINKRVYVVFEQKKQMLMSILGAIAGYSGAQFIHSSGNPSPHISQDITVFKYIFFCMFIFSLAVFLYSLLFLRRYKHNQSN